MNVLELVQAFGYEAGIGAVPTTLIGLSDVAQLKILHLLYATHRKLRAVSRFPTQKKKYSFTTTASRRTYPLPKDFYAMIGNTEWDQNENRPMDGALSDQRIQSRLYLYELSGPPYGYRVFGPDGNPATTGGQFEVDPTPSEAVTLSFEYISKSLFIPKYWEAGESVTSGSDYRSASGNIYLAASTGTTGATIPTHTTGTADDGTVDWTYQNIAYETVLADDDQSLFDDELVITGLTWHWNNSNRTEGPNDLAEFQSFIMPSLTRHQGSRRGSMVRGRQDGPRFYVPYRNWGI